jgi:hypothetical protein
MPFKLLAAPFSAHATYCRSEQASPSGVNQGQPEGIFPFELAQREAKIHHQK